MKTEDGNYLLTTSVKLFQTSPGRTCRGFAFLIKSGEPFKWPCRFGECFLGVQASDPGFAKICSLWCRSQICEKRKRTIPRCIFKLYFLDAHSFGTAISLLVCTPILFRPCTGVSTCRQKPARETILFVWKQGFGDLLHLLFSVCLGRY